MELLKIHSLSEKTKRIPRGGTMNAYFALRTLTISILTTLIYLAAGAAYAAGQANPAGTKALAANFDLPVPKHLTGFKHPVIYASADVYAKQVAGKTIVRQVLIIKWGLHVFEVAEGLYQCEGSAATRFNCEWVDHERVATFSSCVVKSKGKPKCTGLRSTNSGPTEDIDADWNSDENRRTSNEWNEYPERQYDPENPIP